MRNDAVAPKLILDAGDAAVRAYREFLEDAKRSPSTRRMYGQYIRRFCRWAEGRGLNLEMIAAPDLAAYAAELRTAKAPSVALTPIRGLFQHLIREGVCSDNPCGSSLLALRGAAHDAMQNPSIPLSELKATLRELDNWEEDSELFQAGLVVVAPAIIGTMEPRAISQFSGVPEPLVREFSYRLMENGVWLPEGKISFDPDNPDGWALEWILNVLIAIGHVEQRPGPKCDDFAGEEPIQVESASSEVAEDSGSGTQEECYER